MLLRDLIDGLGLCDDVLVFERGDLVIDCAVVLRSLMAAMNGRACHESGRVCQVTLLKTREQVRLALSNAAVRAAKSITSCVGPLAADTPSLPP